MNLRRIFYTIEIFLTLAIIFDNLEANNSNLVDSVCLSNYTYLSGPRERCFFIGLHCTNQTKKQLDSQCHLQLHCCTVTLSQIIPR